MLFWFCLGVSSVFLFYGLVFVCFFLFCFVCVGVFLLFFVFLLLSLLGLFLFSVSGFWFFYCLLLFQDVFVLSCFSLVLSHNIWFVFVFHCFFLLFFRFLLLWYFVICRILATYQNIFRKIGNSENPKMKKKTKTDTLTTAVSASVLTNSVFCRPLQQALGTPSGGRADRSSQRATKVMAARAVPLRPMNEPSSQLWKTNGLMRWVQAPCVFWGLANTTAGFYSPQKTHWDILEPYLPWTPPKTQCGTSLEHTCSEHPHFRNWIWDIPGRKLYSELNRSFAPQTKARNKVCVFS